MDLPSLLQKLRPVLGEEGTARAWEQFQLADPKTARLIELSLRRRLAEATGERFGEGILFEPIPEDLAAGDFPLGNASYGTRELHPFALRPGELIQHTAIFGRSGAGKTNVAFLLLKELARTKTPFLVFDWKRNYRDLLPLSGFQNLLVHTVGRDQAPFFFNPLIPPAGVEPREWLKALAEVMAHSYFLGEGVLFVLQEVLDQAYQRFGVYESSCRWPTFRDVYLALKTRKVKGREASWMESALRAVGVLNFGAMDQVLNSGPGVGLAELLGKQAVLELEALTQSDKTFLVEALLLWIHRFRMNEPGRERLKHVLLVEEAHHVLLRKKQELTGAEAVTDVILREVREFGEAIVLLDQLPSLISKPALENSYTTICLNLKEKGDVTAASKAMLLESDEARHLGRLPVGWGVVKLQARWVKPFLVRFPLFPVRKGVVKDSQVRERFLDQLGVEGAARMMREGMEAVARLAVAGSEERAQALEKEKGRHGDGTRMVTLEEQELALLEDVHEHPASTVTERYRRLGLSRDQGTKLVSKLVEAGLLEDASIPIPRGTVRALGLTPDGLSAFGLPRRTGLEGGLEHRYWVERISLELQEAGFQAAKEAPLGNGQAVDLLVTAGERKVAVEVETGKSDWKANVRKCKEAGMDQMIIAATRLALAQGIQEEVGSAPGVRVMAAAEVCELARTGHPGLENGRE